MHFHGSRTITIIVLYIFAVIFAIFSFIVFNNLNINRRYYRETTAEIIDIVEYVYEDYEYDSYYEDYVYVEKVEYKVYLDYEVNGVYYHDVEHCEYNSGMRIGDKIVVNYDSREPGKTVLSPKSTEVICYVMFGVSGILGIVATVLLVGAIKSRRCDRLVSNSNNINY